MGLVKVIQRNQDKIMVLYMNIYLIILLWVTSCDPFTRLVEGHITEKYVCWINPTLYGLRIETSCVNVHGQEETCERARERKLDYANNEDEVSTTPPTA